MRRNVIRLTESQLDRLIEQTLNELAPRTYYNAAKKREQQAQDAKDKPYKELLSWIRNYDGPRDEDGKISLDGPTADRLNKDAANALALANKYQNSASKLRRHGDYVRYNTPRLDWKTYMNAAKKATEKGDARADKFTQAAKDSYCDKYHGRYRFILGTDEFGFDTNSPSWGAHDAIDSEEFVPNTFDFSYRTRANLDDPNNISAEFDSVQNFDRGSKWDGKYPRWGSIYVGDDDEYSYAPRAFNDISNYIKGKSKYTKGKGWNESLAHKVTESIIRKLRKLS